MSYVFLCSLVRDNRCKKMNTKKNVFWERTGVREQFLEENCNSVFSQMRETLIGHQQQFDRPAAVDP